MKRMLFSIGLAAAMMLNTAWAQTREFDQRLTAKFSKKELRKMAAENSAELDYWTYYLDHAYLIMDIVKGKEDGLHQSVPLKSIDPKDINLLALDVEQHEFARRYYRIEGVPGKMLALLPKQEVEAAYGSPSK